MNNIEITDSLFFMSGFNKGWILLLLGRLCEHLLSRQESIFEILAKYAAHLDGSVPDDIEVWRRQTAVRSSKIVNFNRKPDSIKMLWRSVILGASAVDNL